MLRIVFILIGLVVGTAAAGAQEYCVDQYQGAITNANAELGGLVGRQAAIDKRMAAIYVRGSEIAIEIAQAAMKVPPDTGRIQPLGMELNGLNGEKGTLQQEAYGNQDRIVALKGVIPADLQGRLRGCVEASKPAGQIVNLGIQALAILSTGGASLLLPPKALYVDMSAVLNGYPTGGPHSAINEARETALNALGLGGENNTGGKIVRDPVGAIRDLFH
jgi:hypothetical protein